MPTLEHHGARIYYEEFGQGFPILCFAPAGLLSTIAVWSGPMPPINPMTEFSADYRVIVMDQRNAPGGRSWAPITDQDGWDSFTADHIALLDHLGIDKCHLYGQCIGGPFIMNFLKAQPGRVARTGRGHWRSGVRAQRPAGGPPGRAGDFGQSALAS